MIVDKALAVCDNVRTMLSELSSVQTNLDAGSAVDALEKIFLYSYEGDGEEDPPRIAVFCHDGDWGVLEGYGFDGILPVDIVVQYPIPDASVLNRSTQARWFLGQIQTLWNEMQTNVRGGGQLDLRNFSWQILPVPVEELSPTVGGNRVVWEMNGQLQIGI